MLPTIHNIAVQDGDRTTLAVTQAKPTSSWRQLRDHVLEIPICSTSLHSPESVIGDYADHRLLRLVQGATIHQFDPNDSPTEKARQILNQGNGVQALAPVDLTALPGLAAMNLTPGEIKAKVLNGSTSNRELKEGAGVKVTPAAEKELEKEKLEALKDTGRIDAEGAKQPPGAMPPPGAKPRDSEFNPYLAAAFLKADLASFLSSGVVPNRGSYCLGFVGPRR